MPLQPLSEWKRPRPEAYLKLLVALVQMLLMLLLLMALVLMLLMLLLLMALVLVLLMLLLMSPQLGQQTRSRPRQPHLLSAGARERHDEATQLWSRSQKAARYASVETHHGTWRRARGLGHRRVHLLLCRL